MRPEAILARLLKDDPRAELRQLAIVDMKGRAAVHNPTAAPQQSRYWAAMTGRYYCCQGNTLTGRDVITAMSEADFAVEPIHGLAYGAFAGQFAKVAIR